MPKAAATADDSLWPPATADALGRLLNISGRRVRELASEGVFPRVAGGRYPVEPCVHAYVGSIRAATKAKPTTVDPQVAAAAIDGRQQRARLARLQADRIALELERERGRLVDADEILGHYTKLVVEARNRLIAVPSEAKSEIPHLTVNEIETLEGLISRALEQVAHGEDEDDAEGES